MYFFLYNLEDLIFEDFVLACTPGLLTFFLSILTLTIFATIT